MISEAAVEGASAENELGATVVVVGEDRGDQAAPAAIGERDGVVEHRR